MHHRHAPSCTYSGMLPALCCGKSALFVLSRLTFRKCSTESPTAQRFTTTRCVLFIQSVIQFLIILLTSHKKMLIFANLNPPSVHFGVLLQATLVGLSRYWKAMEGFFAYSCVAKIYRELLLEYLYKTSAACLSSTVLWLYTSSK